MFAGMRSFAQSLAEQFMEDEVTIRHRLPSDEDADNPYGDDTIEFADSSTVTTKGWMVSELTKSVDSVGGLDAVVERATIRLPVGTVVDSGDEITLRSRKWTVSDVSEDETWPAMLKVAVARVGNG